MLLNVGGGYLLSLITQWVAFPLILEIHPTLAANIKIGLVFAVVSFCRGYGLRRLFEHLRVKREGSTSV